MIEQTAYMAAPTGGVKLPTVAEMMKIIPKCTGSPPSCVTTGRKIGVNMMMRTVASMKKPVISTKMEISAMTAEQAKKYGIEEGRHIYFYRITTGDKRNLEMPKAGESAKWYEFMDVFSATKWF